MTLATGWKPYDPCPCECGTVGWKLSRFGHVVGCSCRSCTGRRSRSKGQKAQSKVLKAAARAQGVTMEIAPTHEEQARLLVHYESKSGDQVWKALGGQQRGGALLREWEKQARDFALRQVPRRKWALVFTMPGTSERRIWMDFDAYCELVNEIQELP